MNEKIDVHKKEAYYQKSLKNFESDPKIILENKLLILDFLRDCELGKTVRNKSKKKIGVAKRQKYLDLLKDFVKWSNKPFKDIDIKDMERIILALDRNVYKKKNGKPFSDATKVDYKLAIRKFYKWYKGNNITCPEIVSWIETYHTLKEIPALTRKEIEVLIDSASDTMLKTAIMILFDSGARIEELLNLRLNNITKEEDYYLLRIEYSKTKPRTVSVPMSTELLERWLKEHPNRDNSYAQLFPIEYPALRKRLLRLGNRVLKKNINPHLFRHSSATYYANKLNHFQMCVRYGWTMSSDMPARYIDRAGVSEKETAKIVKNANINEIKEENQRLKEDLSLMKEQIDKLNEKTNVFLNKIIDKLDKKELKGIAKEVGL